MLARLAMIGPPGITPTTFGRLKPWNAEAAAPPAAAGAAADAAGTTGVAGGTAPAGTAAAATALDAFIELQANHKSRRTTRPQPTHLIDEQLQGIAMQLYSAVKK